MKENNVLIPEIYASYPYDGKILEYYQGVFESVYIVLHPFYKAVTLELEHYNVDRWPEKNDFIKGHYPIAWHEILNLSELENISQIDVALRTMIGAIKQQYENRTWAKQVFELYEQCKIIPCDEGYISPFLENPLLYAIKELGYDYLITVDEFGFNDPEKMQIDYLIDNDQLDKCNYTEDHQLLFATHWDSHCTFLCSSKKFIDQILEIHPFEGFFCTPQTEVYWGLHEI